MQPIPLSNAPNWARTESWEDDNHSGDEAMGEELKNAAEIGNEMKWKREEKRKEKKRKDHRREKVAVTARRSTGRESTAMTDEAQSTMDRGERTPVNVKRDEVRAGRQREDRDRQRQTETDRQRQRERVRRGRGQKWEGRRLAEKRRG